MVAGNRTRDYTVAILTRLVLIAVGACTCFIINICIYPIWAGDDLHRLVVNNFMELATSFEGCVNGYLKYVDLNRNSSRFMNQSPSDQLFLGYKLVIESASREQNLLGFAVWEPPHGRYRALHNPWRIREIKWCSEALRVYCHGSSWMHFIRNSGTAGEEARFP